MRERYKNARTSGIRAEILAGESDGKDAFIVSAEAMQGSSKPSNIVFTVRRTKDGLKVDWPASVGSNPTPLKTLFADFPKGAAKVRVVAEPANYFNYEYRKTENDYFSIRLKEAVPPFSCHGYISKTDEHGKSLFKLLKDGKGHRVLIEIDLIGPNNESAVETARPTF